MSLGCVQDECAYVILHRNEGGKGEKIGMHYIGTDNMLLFCIDAQLIKPNYEAQRSLQK